METSVHVRDSVKEIDKSSWLIGNSYIIRHIPGPFNGDCLWEDPENASHYTLTPAPAFQSSLRPIDPDGHARKIYDVADRSAVFSFGDALIVKVKISTDNTRREPETLAFLSKQKLSFDTPTVLCHFEEAGKIFLIERFALGKRLDPAWWEMNEDEKEHVVTRIADICAEIRTFKSSVLTGVDYNWLDPLQQPGHQTVELLQQPCEDLGMDCSEFVLSHNDFSPLNIIIGTTGGSRFLTGSWLGILLTRGSEPSLLSA